MWNVDRIEKRNEGERERARARFYGWEIRGQKKENEKKMIILKNENNRNEQMQDEEKNPQEDVAKIDVAFLPVLPTVPSCV